MGLDMYLNKVNMKLDQEELNDFSRFENISYDLDNYRNYTKEFESCESAESFVLKRMDWKLKEYEKWDEAGRTDNGFMDGFVWNVISTETPKFKDFNTKEDLIKYYSKEFLKYYMEIKDKLNKLETDIDVSSLIEKFKDVNSTEAFYWRKHADLNQYFTTLAKERGLTDEGAFGTDFNGQSLLLTKSDIEELVDLICRHLSGKDVFEKGHGFFWGESTREQWVDTKDVFEDLLKDFDFGNNTLYYSCSW